MKLLLDEMYPPRVAGELRKRGHDVAAVADRPELRAMEDESLLMTASADERALVTENVADYPEIVASLATEDRTHRGVVLVPSHRFPRTEHGLGVLVRALDLYLERHANARSVDGGIHWLRAQERR